MANKGNILNQTDDGFLKNGYFSEERLVNGVVNKPSKEKKKKFLITCGWCGNHHPSHTCTKKHAKAWREHTCRKCLGKGHPAAVCPSNQPCKFVNKTVSKFEVFTTFLVEGPFGETSCKMPITSMAENFIIDSGAAVSVAPPSFCPEISVDPSGKSKYKLQSASGQRLQVYGSKVVPIKLADSEVKIVFVICEVTQPLVSALDLNNKGIAILLNPKEPKLIFENGSFPLGKDLHFF